MIYQTNLVLEGDNWVVYFEVFLNLLVDLYSSLVFLLAFPKNDIRKEKIPRHSNFIKEFLKNKIGADSGLFASNYFRVLLIFWVKENNLFNKIIQMEKFLGFIHHGEENFNMDRHSKFLQLRQFFYKLFNDKDGSLILIYRYR